jgi:hypothetical protein
LRGIDRGKIDPAARDWCNRADLRCVIIADVGEASASI